MKFSARVVPNYVKSVFMGLTRVQNINGSCATGDKALISTHLIQLVWNWQIIEIEKMNIVLNKPAVSPNLCKASPKTGTVLRG